MLPRYIDLQIRCLTLRETYPSSIYSNTKRRPRIKIKLMSREQEGKDINARSDPAVVRILQVATFYDIVKALQRREAFLLQW